MSDQEQQQPHTGLGAVGKGTVSTPRPQAQEDEPTWTTGQGIGFLVALPGWILAAVGLLGIGPAAQAGGEVIGIALAVGGLGVITAIPGTIVFNKCKRHPGKRQATTSKNTRKAKGNEYTPGW